jgi:hypothetical protein
MARFLHLLKGDSVSLAASVIEETSRQPDAEVVAVMLDDAIAPTLSPAVQLLRLGHQHLDYSALLDLIFQSDHVVSW